MANIKRVGKVKRGRKAVAAGVVSLLVIGPIVAEGEKFEKVHVELPSFPEVHGEYLETMISTATVTHHGRFNFDFPASIVPE